MKQLIWALLAIVGLVAVNNLVVIAAYTLDDSFDRSYPGWGDKIVWFAPAYYGLTLYGALYLLRDKRFAVGCAFSILYLVLFYFSYWNFISWYKFEIIEAIGIGEGVFRSALLGILFILAFLIMIVELFFLVWHKMFSPHNN